jgi:hypothetical protein
VTRETKSVAVATKSQDKTGFVRKFLSANTQGNVKAVNESWTAAGFEGTISPTVVNTVRASLGLTGNFRANTRKSKTAATGKKRGEPRKKTNASVGVQPRANESALTVKLNDLEADIDRLIFRAMAIGDLTEFEATLRQARRLLYGALSRG